MDTFVMTQLIVCGCKGYLKNFEHAGVGKDEFMKLTLRGILHILDPTGQNRADLEAGERILARKYVLLNTLNSYGSRRIDVPESHGPRERKEDDRVLDEDDGVSSTSSRSKHSDFDNRSSVTMMEEHQSSVSSCSTMSEKMVSELRYYIRQETQNLITKERFTAATNELSTRISENKSSINQLEQMSGVTRRRVVAVMSGQNQADPQTVATITHIQSLPHPWSRLRQASRFAARKNKRAARYRQFRQRQGQLNTENQV